MRSLQLVPSITQIKAPWLDGFVMACFPKARFGEWWHHPLKKCGQPKVCFSSPHPQSTYAKDVKDFRPNFLWVKSLVFNAYGQENDEFY